VVSAVTSTTPDTGTAPGAVAMNSTRAGGRPENRAVPVSSVVWGLPAVCLIETSLASVPSRRRYRTTTPPFGVGPASDSPNDSS
jgi:hypothetical protein